MAQLLNVAIPAVIALVAVYYVIGAFVNYRRLRQFRGPTLASFSRGWLFFEEVRGRLAESQFKALEKYGSPARIGHDLLITDDAELIRHMNAPGSRWTRSGWYDAMRMDPRRDNVFSARDEKLHAELKAQEGPGYNGRDVNTLEPDIDARVGDLIQLIRKRKGKSMDFALTARYFVLDSLSTVAFGRPFGFMAADCDLWDYNKTASDFLLILGLTANHSSIRALLSQDWVQALAAPKLTDKSGIGPALAFARKAVAERYGPDAKQRKDMLGSFVAKGLSQVQCEVEAFLQIMAGTDSTTTILRCIMFLLTSNPMAYAKLRAEVDGLTSNIAPGPARYTELLKLGYLKAAIWETIRLFPPLFGLKEKCAPPGGEEVNGIFYPGGVGVAICDDAVCRKKEIFGEDSDIFRPERFLEGDEVLQRKRLQTVEVVFGSGRFQCLGKHIAMMELHKAVFEILRTYDLVLADPFRGVSTIRHNTHVQSGMNMVAYER